jgi:oligopeptide transport system permease protein
MFKTILLRLGQGLLVLYVLFTLTFFLCLALPYNALQTEKAMPKHVKEKLEAYHGFNEPKIVQYGKQLSHFISGDPGYSWRLEGRPVTGIVGESFANSLLLGGVSMVLAIIVGIPLGVIAAWKKNSSLDYLCMAVAMIGICLPSFVTGPLLAEGFGRKTQWLPAMGWSPTDVSTWVLPAITLAMGTAAYLSRLTRAGMMDVLSQDYVRTARAKGVGSFRLLTRHCLRGGIIPAVAFIGPAFAGIISGSVVIESIFSLPGLGTQFMKAISENDRPVVLGIVMLYGVLILIANFLTDLLGLWLNPKLRSAP